jgi:hypothetical protein
MDRKVLGLKSRTFWTILVGVNITSMMICIFSGSNQGAIYSCAGMVACYYMLIMSDKEE